MPKTASSKKPRSPKFEPVKIDLAKSPRGEDYVIPTNGAASLLRKTQAELYAHLDTLSEDELTLLLETLDRGSKMFKAATQFCDEALARVCSFAD